jgi:hypothetical protein
MAVLGFMGDQRLVDYTDFAEYRRAIWPIISSAPLVRIGSARWAPNLLARSESEQYTFALKARRL